MALSPHREDKRQKIIDAAIEVFADEGFFSARISQIAAVAGVADGTIYLYFSSKDELLASLFREKMNDILQRFSAIVNDDASPEEKLRRYVAEHLALVEARPKLMQVLTVELRQSARFMREHTPKAFGRYLGLLAALIEEGQKKGAFRSGLDPTTTSRALFGAIDGLSLSRILRTPAEPNRSDLPATAANLTDLFLNGLRPISTGAEGMPTKIPK